MPSKIMVAVDGSFLQNRYQMASPTLKLPVPDDFVETAWVSALATLVAMFQATRVATVAPPVRLRKLRRLISLVELEPDVAFGSIS